MRRLGSFLVVLFISAGLLGGVANAGTPDGGSVPTVGSLLGKGFASVKVSGNPAIGQKQLRIAFSGTSSRPYLTVRGGCNVWRAGFRFRNGRLFLKGPASGTKMACAEDPDPWIRSKFRRGMKARSKGNRLIMTRPAQRVRFVFRLVSSKRQAVDSEVPLGPDPEPRVTVPATMDDVLGKAYQAISVIGPDLDRTLRIGFEMGTRGSPDELVSGPTFGFHAGCNHFGGWAAIENGVLSWTEVVQTMMLCEDTPDEWLTPFFTNDPEIGLDGTDLVIRKDGIEIVFEAIRD